MVIRYKSLHEFIERLDKEGELIRIKKSVTPILEIAEITDRVCKSGNGGKALLFENVEGSSMPLLINAYGSEKRINMALGVEDIEDTAARLSALINMKPPSTLYEKVGILKTLFEVGQFPPVLKNGSAPCQEVIWTGDEVDLSKIPVLKCWPEDAGRFITFPVVFTKGLYNKKRNVGMYRLQVFDQKSTGMHWHIHKDAAAQFDLYKKEGKQMEVAVAIGTDPVVTYAATAPMPPEIDELLLAGFIRKKGVELVKCKTVDLEVPATAEIILEGYVNPDELQEEGPFGDHTGYYSLKGRYPVFHVTAITHRHRPVYFTTIVGKPPMEDCYLGKATERLFLPLIKTVSPEIEDMAMPWEGVFHNCVIVSMKKRYPMQARKLMSSMWGTGQMSFAKMILVVDADINVHDFKKVAEYTLELLDITKDLVISEGILDVLDHSAPEPLYGKKVGFDATRRIVGEAERGSRETLKDLGGEDISLEILQKNAPEVSGFSVPFLNSKNRILFLSLNKEELFQVKKTAEAFWETELSNSFRGILFFDASVDVSDHSVVLWRLFNNVDSGRDFIWHGSKLTIDATKKLPEEGYDREWPNDIIMDKGVVDRIDRRWKDLGL